MSAAAANAQRVQIMQRMQRNSAWTLKRHGFSLSEWVGNYRKTFVHQQEPRAEQTTWKGLKKFFNIIKKDDMFSEDHTPEDCGCRNRDQRCDGTTSLPMHMRLPAETRTSK